MATNETARAAAAGKLESAATELTRLFLTVRVEMLYFAWKEDKARVATANQGLDAFMASGAMLLSGTRDAPPLTFYRRRLPRLLLPLLCWSLVYFIFTEQAWPTLADIPRFLNKLLANKNIGLLWYLYMLLGIYLSTPFLQMILRQAKRSHLWIFVGICLVLGSLQRQFTNIQTINLGLDHSIFEPYIGYFLLGHLLHTAGPRRIGRRWTLAGLYLLLSLGSFVGFWLQQRHGGKILYNFLDYSSINVALASAALFAALDGLSFLRSGWLARSVFFVSNATYGIYLVHILAYAMLSRGLLGFTVKLGQYPPALNIPLVAIGMARGLDEGEATSTIVRGFLNVDIMGLPKELKDTIDATIAESEKDMF